MSAAACVCLTPIEKESAAFRSLLLLRDRAIKLKNSAEYYESLKMSETAKDRRTELDTIVPSLSLSLSLSFSFRDSFFLSFSLSLSLSVCQAKKLQPGVVTETISSFYRTYGVCVLHSVSLWQTFVAQTLSTLTELKSHTLSADSEDEPNTHTPYVR